MTETLGICMIIGLPIAYVGAVVLNSWNKVYGKGQNGKLQTNHSEDTN